MFLNNGLTDYTLFSFLHISPFKLYPLIENKFLTEIKKEHFENINALFDLLDNNFLYVFIFFSNRMPDKFFCYCDNHPLSSFFTIGTSFSIYGITSNYHLNIYNLLFFLHSVSLLYVTFTVYLLYKFTYLYFVFIHMLQDDSLSSFICFHRKRNPGLRFTIKEVNLVHIYS